MKIYLVVSSICALLLSIFAFVFSLMHYYFLPQPLDHAYLTRLQKVMKVYDEHDKKGRLIALGHFNALGKGSNLIIFRDRSTFANKKSGQPSIYLNNTVTPLKSVELGFYQYGPTLTSDNSIFEFWLGNPHDDVASVSILNKAGGANSTARLEIRYPGDEGAVLLDSNYKIKDQYVSRVWETDKKRSLLVDVPVIHSKGFSSK